MTGNDFACRSVYLERGDTAACDMGPAALIRIYGSLSPDDRVVIQLGMLLSFCGANLLDRRRENDEEECACAR